MCRLEIIARFGDGCPECHSTDIEGRKAGMRCNECGYAFNHPISVLDRDDVHYNVVECPASVCAREGHRWSNKARRRTCLRCGRNEYVG